MATEQNRRSRRRRRSRACWCRRDVHTHCHWFDQLCRTVVSNQRGCIYKSHDLEHAMALYIMSCSVDCGQPSPPHYDGSHQCIKTYSICLPVSARQWWDQGTEPQNSTGETPSQSKMRVAFICVFLPVSILALLIFCILVLIPPYWPQDVTLMIKWKCSITDA